MQGAVSAQNCETHRARVTHTVRIVSAANMCGVPEQSAPGWQERRRSCRLLVPFRSATRNMPNFPFVAREVAGVLMRSRVQPAPSRQAGSSNLRDLQSGYLFTRLDNGRESEVDGLPRLRYSSLWTVAPGGIYFVPADASRSIRYFDFATRQMRSVFEVDTDLGSGRSVSSDGRWICVLTVPLLPISSTFSRRADSASRSQARGSCSAMGWPGCQACPWS